MRYALTSAQMQALDRRSIEGFGVPSLVLMERAALAVRDEALKLLDRENANILIVAGCGNNGADALAAGRMLYLKGHMIQAVIVGNEEKASEEFRVQREILDRMHLPVTPFSEIKETPDTGLFGYDLILDGLFGVGLNRSVEGVYAEALTWMREVAGTTAADRVRAKVLAVDIASGVSADDGSLLGPAVAADVTVTFQCAKAGHMLFPGKEMTGRLVVADIGIIEEPGETPEGICYRYFDEDPATLFPARQPDTHKGSYGKLLVIAGSRDTGGCTILTAKAALRSGVGMVRVLTHAANRTALLSAVPEAMVDVYDDDTSSEALAALFASAAEWSDAVAIGPGTGTSETARTLLSLVLTTYEKSVVADADALNLIAMDEALRTLAMNYADAKCRSLILTPHAAEFARLIGRPVAECRTHAATYPKELADNLHAVVLMKDAVSITASHTATECVINTSGNNGMATAGSGDVLTGIIGALAAYGMKPFGAAARSAFLHGAAGDRALSTHSATALNATDIIDAIGTIGAIGVRSPRRSE